MPKRSEELVKHSLYLKKDEMERLRDIYPEVGAAAIVRTLINKHLREVEAKVDENAPVNTIDVLKQGS